MACVDENLTPSHSLEQNPNHGSGDLTSNVLEREDVDSEGIHAENLTASASFSDEETASSEDDSDSEDDEETSEENVKKMAEQLAKAIRANLSKIALQKNELSTGTKDLTVRFQPKANAVGDDGMEIVKSEGLETVPEEGISWVPQVEFGHSKSYESTPKPTQELEKKLKEATAWQTEKVLQDGLLVPPRDPKKLNRLIRKQRKDTLGSKWFDMPAQTLTPELKKDLQLLKMRDVIDPKRHYKADDSKKLPKYFQVGTVIEPASEFYSRLTKKERKQSIADELLSNENFNQYRKRKHLEIEREKNPVGKNGYKRKKRNNMHKKHRR